MKNLEQIRAKQALKFWENQREEDGTKGENGGDVVRGLGSLIINNGLLATLAFANEKKKGYEKFMEEIGRYLQSKGEDGRKFWDEDTSTLSSFIKKLTTSDSQILQLATSESLAYLSFLKRFRK